MKRIFVDIERCLSCRSCEIACGVKHSESKTLFKAIKEDPLPLPRIRVTSQQEKAFPIQCRHCPEPYCLYACIAGAIRRDKETGLILTDENKCVHCYSCVMVCPYGVIRVGGKGEVAVKCDFCQDEEIPPCVEACPTGALFFGEREEFLKIVEKRRNALSHSG